MAENDKSDNKMIIDKDNKESRRMSRINISNKLSSLQRLQKSCKQLVTRSQQIENLAELRQSLEKKQKSKEDKQQIFNILSCLQFYEDLKKHLKIEDENVMKNILYCSQIEQFSNKYVFRENDKLDKKYYVLLQGHCTQKRNPPKTIDEEEEERIVEPVVKSQINRRPTIMMRRQSAVITLCSLDAKKSLFFQLSQTVRIGDGFGEQIFMGVEKRDYGVLTRGTVDLLVIDQTNVVRIKQMFCKSSQQKQKTILAILPGLQQVCSSLALNIYLDLFDPMECSNKTVLTQQNMIQLEHPFIYLLSEGVCSVYRSEMGDFAYQVKHVYLCDVQGHNFIGEELLIQDAYDYTVIVKSESCLLYRIDKRKFLARFALDIKTYVLDLYHSKHQWRITKMMKQLKCQETHSDKNMQDFLEMEVVAIMNTQMQNHYYQKVIEEQTTKNTQQQKAITFNSNNQNNQYNEKFINTLDYLQIELGKRNFNDFGFRGNDEKIQRIMQIKMANLKVDLPKKMKPNCIVIKDKTLRRKAKNIYQREIMVGTKKVQNEKEEKSGFRRTIDSAHSGLNIKKGSSLQQFQLVQSKQLQSQLLESKNQIRNEPSSTTDLMSHTNYHQEKKYITDFYSGRISGKQSPSIEKITCQFYNKKLKPPSIHQFNDSFSDLKSSQILPSRKMDQNKSSTISQKFRIAQQKNKKIYYRSYSFNGLHRQSRETNERQKLLDSKIQR